MLSDRGDLFDREFVETQEAVGIRVICQFRDADDRRSRGWSDVTDALADGLKAPPEIHRLLPPPRSLLHG